MFHMLNRVIFSFLDIYFIIIKEKREKCSKRQLSFCKAASRQLAFVDANTFTTFVKQYIDSDL